MKTPPSLLVGLGLFTASAWAQPTSPPPAAPAPAVSTASYTQEVAVADAPQRTAEQLEQLLGPIALYPDALIAIILPAATSASDIVLASRFLGANGDTNQIDSQPWDESVKSLARYPEVVKWMDENLEWTKQVGEAFATQPTDVMNAVQRLRTRAREAGTLVDTPQQQVVMQDDAITIVPAEPDVIYVPRYDPAIVYVSGPRSYGYSYVSFGPAYPIGAWLSFDCDWRQHRVWIDRRFPDNRSPRDLRRPPTFPVGPSFAPNSNFRPWRPSPTYVRSRPADPQWRSRQIVRPEPLPGTPVRPNSGFTEDSRRRWNNNNNNNDSSTPRVPPADGRNHGSVRRRNEPPTGTNPAVATAPTGVTPAYNPPRTNGPVVATPGSTAPTFANPTNDSAPHTSSRRDRPDGNDQARGINPPNFRAGAIERPRSSLPAPGIPLDRTGPGTRNAAALPAPTAPVISNPAGMSPTRNSGAVVSPGNNSTDSAGDGRDGRDSREGRNAHLR